MPVTITGETNVKLFKQRDLDFKKKAELFSYDADEKYPRDLDLTPGSDLHDKIVGRLVRFASASSAVMQSRHSSWKDVDRVLRSYVRPEAKGDQKLADDVFKKDQKEDTYQFVLPISFTNLETLMTFLTGIFLDGQYPRYEGTGPEDSFGAELLQLDVRQQLHRKAGPLALYFQMQDALKYGVGVIAPRWIEERGRVVERSTKGVPLDGKIVMTNSEKRVNKRGITYAGNILENVDPYSLLLDPAVAPHKVAQGEFVGWVSDGYNLNSLKSAADYDDRFFNIQYLRELASGRSQFSSSDDRFESTRKANRTAISGLDPIDVLWFYVTVIPSEWELGGSESPEEWCFALASDNVLISAFPIEEEEKPVYIMSPDSDGYSASPFGRMEIVHDLQVLPDFMWGARVQNIRRLVNLMLIIDPSVIYMQDFYDSKHGGVIRAMDTVWGKGKLKEAYEQITIQDVTQGLLSDAQFLMDFSQRATGATDPAQGNIVNTGPRISSTATQKAAASSLGRVGRIAFMMSQMSFLPLARNLGRTTQENRTGEMFYRLTGGEIDRLKKEYGEEDLNIQRSRLRGSAHDLMVNFDCLAFDGTVPGSSDTQSLLTGLQIAGQNPAFFSRLDFEKVFLTILQNEGLKNPERFLKQGQPAQRLLPDESVDAQVQQGNLVPAVGGDGLA